MLNEFRSFVLRGNLVELAVAFVMGAAFTKLVQSFVTALITPLIALLAGKPDFGAVDISVRGTAFELGLLLDAAFALVATAAVVFFVVVKPFNALQRRLDVDGTQADGPSTRDCPQCLSQVPAAARRCAHCTSDLIPAAGA